MLEKSEYPMMLCGCQANGQDKEGRPVCCVHIGLMDGARIVNTETLNLSGREAKCGYCGTKRKSEDALTGQLAFFQHRPGREFDDFYDGCRGWD